MKEIEHKGHIYRIGDMTPMVEVHLLRRLGPFLPALAPVIRELTDSGPDALAIAKAAGPLADVLAKMTDEEAEEIIYRSLAVVARKGNAGWAPVMTAHGIPGFDDLSMMDILKLTVSSIQENFGPFFGELRTVGNTT